MKKKTIKLELIRDNHAVEFQTAIEFHEKVTHIFEIPRLDLEEWHNAHIRITIKKGKIISAGKQ